jgi:RHS repeat-associated protein
MPILSQSTAKAHSQTTKRRAQGCFKKRSGLAKGSWGKRRYPNGLQDKLDQIVPQTTDRGYTEHEHLDEVGVVHMNGRIYDPLVGRFMSADPFIQAPFELQSHNRYAYVMNNPLAFTDPSGYLFGDLKGGRWTNVAKTVVVIYVAYQTGQWAQNWLMTSAANGFVATGATSSMFAAGIGTEAAGLTISGYAASGAAAGFAGGFSGSVLNGGNFEDSVKSGLRSGINGAIGGAVAGYYGSDYPLSRVGANTVVGGVQSKIQGGSFADGARTSFKYSALAYLNVQMRNRMIEQSKIDSKNDGTGLSRGMFGDGFKLAGGRFDPFAKTDAVCSPLGCNQNGLGSISLLGNVMKYESGGFIDMINESFAGPHDTANAPWYYDAKGLIASGTEGLTRELLTNYTTSLIFAAPFAAGAIYEQAGVSAYDRRKK